MYIALCFILTILLHTLCCYSIKSGTALLKLLIVGIPIGIAVLFISYNQYGLSSEMFCAAAIYAFMCELYMFLFTFVFTSISVSIILLLAESDIKIETLEEQYEGKRMVRNRLKRMQEVELLVKDLEVLNITAKGINMLKFFRGFRKFFKLEA